MSSKEDEPGSSHVNIRFIIESVLIIALITGVVIAAQYTKAVDYGEKVIDDIAVANLTPNVKNSHPRVAVVAIDEKTINQLPARSPIDRRFLGDLLKAIDSGEPAGIGIDIVFFEESRDPADDLYLTKVLSEMKTPVVLATGLKNGEIRSLAKGYAESGADIALVNLPVDLIDRTLRTHRPSFADKHGELHDTIAVVLARKAGAEVASSTEDIAIDWYGRPGYQDRLLPGGGFAGPPPVATIPAWVLLQAPIAAKALKNKVVFIGATFEGSADYLRTPFDMLELGDESFAGVFGHAQIAAQLLDGRSRPVVGPVAGLALVLGAVIIGMLLAIVRLPAIIPLILALVLPVAWILFVFYVRKETSVGLPALPPALGAGLALATFALFRARRFDAASRIAAKALNSYLPPELAKRVLKDPSLLKLGGEPRDLSVLFTDIAGFTTFSERNPPDEVVGLLNRYLDRMAQLVLEHNGTLDKFIGDAVMAFYGAPVTDPTHSSHAISCALSMDRFCREFEVENHLKTRIGVHTGNVIVGNVGGEQRFDYTVIGDVVNSAARLEGANKYIGIDAEHITTICISGDTVAHCRETSDEADALTLNLTGDEMRSRPEGTTLRRIGKIVLKGRASPLDVFTTAPDDYTPENLDTYIEALESLEAGNHDEAGKIFKDLYNDDLSAYQRLRCERRDGPTLTLTEK